MRLHREDVGAIDQSFIRIGIVGSDLFDQFILSKHFPKMGGGCHPAQARTSEAGRLGGLVRPLPIAGTGEMGARRSGTDPPPGGAARS
jgi:hypothetical protein